MIYRNRYNSCELYKQQQIKNKTNEPQRVSPSFLDKNDLGKRREYILLYNIYPLLVMEKTLLLY